MSKSYLKVSEIIRIIGEEETTSLKSCDTLINNFWIFPSDINENSIYFHWQVGEQKKHLIKQALDKGSFVITSEKDLGQLESSERIIKVRSVRNSLIKIARFMRDRYKGHVVAITGSVGKSSVKNIISQILSIDNEILSTKGNENAWLGIYSTLCNLNSHVEYAILETGASGPRSLSTPISIVKPTIAILLEVSISHLGKYKSFKDLLLEKASVINNIVPNGTLIISYRTKILLLENDYIFRDDIKVIVVGDDIACDFYIKDFNLNLKKSYVNAVYKSEYVSLESTTPSKALLVNSCYSYAFLKEVGFSSKKFNALSKFFIQMPRRYDRIRVNYNSKIFELIDDAYNSSPASCVDLFDSILIRKPNRKVLILGDMLDLGENELVTHSEILTLADKYGFDKIVLIGEIFSSLKTDAIICFKDVKESIGFISQLVESGDLIVLKASGGINLIDVRNYFAKYSKCFKRSNTWYIEEES